MSRPGRPFGREKNITDGGGNAHKRGEGLGGGSVGGKDGYSGKHDGSQGKSVSGGQRAIRTAGKTSPLLIVIVIALYFLLGRGGGAENPLPSIIGGGNGAQSTIAGPASSSGIAAGLGELDRSVSASARPKRGITAGDDSVTIMVYMCASDLEARGGAATADLQEMLNARIADNVNIIVETGGAAKWQNNTVSSKTNQIYRVGSNGLELVRDNLGERSMVDPGTLTDFIKFCKSNYPAGRYGLIFWDHGGGSLSGFGYDMKFPGGSMTLDKIDAALRGGDCAFDFIGFDACLMATLETAIVMEQYADYLIASQDTEPGGGWYYTNWLTRLSEDTSIDTLDLGKHIIDDYVSYTPAGQGPLTLSLIDLAELKGTVPGTFQGFAQSTAQLIKSDSYKEVSNVRGNVREFAQSSMIDHIDLIQFARGINTKESIAFASALEGCVKYNLTGKNMKDCGGISVYFPSRRLDNVQNALSTYDKLGIDARYSECIKDYSNLSVGGQIVAGQAQSSPINVIFDAFLGGSNQGSSQSASGQPDIAGLLMDALGGDGLSGIFGGREIPEWVDSSLIESSADYYESNRFDPLGLTFTDKNSGTVLSLPDEQWSLIRDVALNVFLDDGEGFIELGLDNTFSFDADGDLVVDYDHTWISINGQVVSYYFLSMDGTPDDYMIKGRVPAMLNDERVDVMLEFSSENPDGKVLGARIDYDAETETEGKGLIEIKNGDVLDFLCDYYSYDKAFRDNYYLGDRMTVSIPLTISNTAVGSAECLASYRFTDIYGNKYWTPNFAS